MSDVRSPPLYLFIFFIFIFLSSLESLGIYSSRKDDVMMVYTVAWTYDEVTQCEVDARGSEPRQ